jgi:DNA-binding IclR family transcriptional regulator
MMQGNNKVWRSRNGVSWTNESVNMSLLANHAPRYVRLMKQALPISLSATAWIAFGLMVFAAASGLAFASWLDKDAGIFMSLVEAGMSWCF